MIKLTKTENGNYKFELEVCFDGIKKGNVQYCVGCVCHKFEDFDPRILILQEVFTKHQDQIYDEVSLLDTLKQMYVNNGGTNSEKLNWENIVKLLNGYLYSKNNNDYFVKNLTFINLRVKGLNHDLQYDCEDIVKTLNVLSDESTFHENNLQLQLN